VGRTDFGRFGPRKKEIEHVYIFSFSRKIKKNANWLKKNNRKGILPVGKI
jgi:hypothetical protein